ncbi:hypothetical protein FOCG_17839, partial [Fusarium oxysporum f. sp. radicis-lycopersici 26381]
MTGDKGKRLPERVQNRLCTGAKRDNVFIDPSLTFDE